MELLFQKYPLKLGDLGSGFYFERAYFTNYHTVYYTVYDVDEEVLVTSKTNSKLKKVFGDSQIEVKYNK